MFTPQKEVSVRRELVGAREGASAPSALQRVARRNVMPGSRAAKGGMRQLRRRVSYQFRFQFSYQSPYPSSYPFPNQYSYQMSYQIPYQISVLVSIPVLVPLCNFSFKVTYCRTRFGHLAHTYFPSMVHLGTPRTEFMGTNVLLRRDSIERYVVHRSSMRYALQRQPQSEGSHGRQHSPVLRQWRCRDNVVERSFYTA